MSTTGQQQRRSRASDPWQLGANDTWVKPTSPVQKSGKTEPSKEQVTLWR